MFYYLMHKKEIVARFFLDEKYQADKEKKNPLDGVILTYGY